MAALHPAPESDRGWNELAYRALAIAGDARPGVQHTYAPNKTAFKSEMRDYAQRGCTLVICHGSEFVKATPRVAGDFPKCRFVVTGSSDAGQGVTTIDFRLWEAAYLRCAGGAPVAEGPAGLIGGQDFVSVRKTLDAFAEGAGFGAEGVWRVHAIRGQLGRRRQGRSRPPAR
ncbi:MAG: BMP family ABC transporter substrate-binding protein [Phycisphaerae bacterium]